MLLVDFIEAFFLVFFLRYYDTCFFLKGYNRAPFVFSFFFSAGSYPRSVLKGVTWIGWLAGMVWCGWDGVGGCGRLLGA